MAEVPIMKKAYKGCEQLGGPIKKSASGKNQDASTSWNCVFFGEYPASEIVGESFDSVPEKVISDGDLIRDEVLYRKLQAAPWCHGITVINGKKYYRINGSDATTATRSGQHHYRWKSVDEFHYFRFEPIRWRVLENRDGVMTLLSARVLDCQQYNNIPGKTDWASCSLRKWLNGEFVNTAFSEDEKKDILLTENKNAPNCFYNTDCGPDTLDTAFILSNDEVFGSDIAGKYGFRVGIGPDDSSKRFDSTLFAKCRGAWWSPKDYFPGNAFWFMRSNGYSPSTVTYVCDFGYLYILGTEAICDDGGILPAIRVRSSSPFLLKAGTVTAYEGQKTIESYDFVKTVSPDREYLSFGTYPQTEIVSQGPFHAVDAYAVREGDYEVNASLFETLESGVWQNDEMTVEGVRYRRRARPAQNEPNHYRESDGMRFHYFRFDPIRWRVLRRENGNLFLLSARSLDCRIFHDNYRHVNWEISYLREWLNGEFLKTAFSEGEKKRLRVLYAENGNNVMFDSRSGENTADFVAIPADQEVFSSEKAVENGFSPYSYKCDKARQISSSMYSKFMGTWWSPADVGDGNCFWFLRTSGYNNSNVVTVSDCGDILNRGCYVSIRDSGIVPEICIAENKS